MYNWICKPDGTVEMHQSGFVGDAWYYLNDVLCDKYHYVTCVISEKEEIFVWHKDMKPHPSIMIF